ncbi:LysR family transcriptional regulator [Streptomyces palmae]|uniref:LysR family transcriptional regulator n=1 Tax=Streptomyces palmae TaxID=1701085 RepID=A0A4Z0HBU8_9ACTN|nr:LysR substrate-binding domain-containing protein [Streptomyces palmae]TGB16813.1 LysR family transcriptional regulator [Streptomyces palmae]
MDLSALRCFQAVARHEHISRAAEELRVAQPSVSRTIARLERELGVPLFHRQGRRIRLNRYGQTLLRRVDRALHELDDARRELTDAAGLHQGSVSVAAETMLTLTGALTAYRAAHPEVAVHLHQVAAAAMPGRLRAREVDFCLASQPLAGPSLHGIDLAREQVLLAVAEAHPLAGRERVTVPELADEPFITTRPGLWQRALLERLFARHGLRPRITCDGEEPGAIQHLVSAGLGIGLLPAMSRQAAPTAAPVRWLRLDAPDCVRTLTLVWHADAYLSTAARRFRDLVVADLSDGTASGRVRTLPPAR